MSIPWEFLAGALGALVALFVPYLRGKYAGKKDAEIARSEEYINERKKIDALDLGSNDDDTARAERLRNIAKRK